jgi:hypothetical protein
MRFGGLFADLNQTSPFDKGAIPTLFVKKQC